MLFFKNKQIYFFFILLAAIGIGLQIVIYKIAIFGLLFQWIAEKNYKKKLKELKSNHYAVGLMIFYMLYAISFFWSENKGVAIIDMILKAPILILPFIIVSKGNNLSLKQINYVFLSFILSVLALNFYCLADSFLAYLKTHNLNEFYYHKLTVNTHTSAQSMFTCFSIVLSIKLLRNRFISIWLSYLLVFIQLIFVLLLSSRMQIFIMATIIPTYYIFYYSKNLVLGALYTALIFFLAYLFISLPSSSLNHRYKKTISGTSDPREIIWSSGLDVVKQNWLFGAGSGDAKDLLVDQFSNFVLDTSNLNKTEESHSYKQAFMLKYNFHNQYLQTFAAVGIFGFILLCYLLFFPVLFFIRNKDYLCILFLFIISVSFLTESMLERQAGVSFFAFFYSLLIRPVIQNTPS